MACSRLLSCCLLVALACDPDDGGGGASATDSASSAGTGSTGDTSVTTSAGGTDLNLELECTDPRWVYDMVGFSDIWDVAFDGRGHVRVPHWKSEVYEVFDFALDGKVVGRFEVDASVGSPNWGGVDGAGNVVLEYREDYGQQMWLRRYSVDGALLWELDLDAMVGHTGRPPLVAQDGSIIIDGQTSIFKFDAAGAVVWELPNPDFMTVNSINAAGAMVGPVLTTTRLRALAPDGTELWERDWGVQAFSDRLFAIDGSGAVVVSERFVGLARFAADGTLAWERSEEELDVQMDQLAMNASGVVAVLGHPISETGRPRVVRVNPAGETVSTVSCGKFNGTQLAIDASGAIAVSGFTFDNGHYDWFVTALD